MRLGLSLTTEEEARAECYVDDPIILLRGSQQTRSRVIAMLLLAWRALGFPLSFEKAVRGSRVQWIVGDFAFTKTGVQVRIKQDIVDDVRALTKEIGSANLVNYKVLRSFCGKVNTITSLVHVLKPFTQQLWAALTSRPENTKAPVGMVWTRQISTALAWLDAFTAGENNAIARNFELSDYLHLGRHVAITIDACPWGIGGIL